MPSGPPHHRIPMAAIRRELPPYKQRYPRPELIDVLINLCISSERERREAEEAGRNHAAGKHEGELSAYQFVLLTLLLSTDDLSPTSGGRAILERLERCLEV